MLIAVAQVQPHPLAGVFRIYRVGLAPGIGGSAPYTVTAGLIRERTDRVEELRDRFTRFTACIDTAMTVRPTTSAETIHSILTARWPAKDIGILRATPPRR